MHQNAMTDAVHRLSHDHADLNARVLLAGTGVRALDGAEARMQELASQLRELRERLFLHFAREEEGLFPFVADTIPALAEQVTAMAIAHDTICGALARMCHLTSANHPVTTLTALFDRFEASYIEHARAEAALLGELDQRLDATQRRQLAELVAGL